jgi:hypothetical protein
MKTNAKIEVEKNRLEQLITTELKNRIKELDLIDTGAMLSTIKSSIKFTSNGYDIDIMSTDYFDEIDLKYEITDYVLNLPMVEEGIGNLFADIVLLEMLD